MRSENDLARLSREEKIEMLKAQFKVLKNDYPEFWSGKFRADGIHMECNHGGLCVKIDRLNEAVIIWRDWSGNAIDHRFQMSEIFYTDDGDPYVIYNEEEVTLDLFMRVDYE